MGDDVGPCRRADTDLASNDSFKRLSTTRTVPSPSSRPRGRPAMSSGFAARSLRGLVFFILASPWLGISCSGQQEKPYFSAFQRCLREHGAASLVVGQEVIGRAVRDCEEQLGPMPLIDTPFAQVDELDEATLERANHVFLEALETCLNSRGSHVEVMDKNGVWELAFSGGRIPEDLLESCTLSAQEIELRFVKGARSP